ncbi:TPA: aminodeoxychorismate/anthranilate synthase component II [Candidatus Micrarchaeota archaeon]|nr:aminodeoxychorismate/anthranilate synthase component II [Candidatus Micrarchaeota archaeon]HIH30431.1 aminodeoxychorismate/anthranilate synthase component II [Candidatus Micrarchaeota archaeon]
MILLIDNYDSFTYNLHQCLCSLGGQVTVKRNDEIGIGQVRGMAPDRIVLSPGPGHPATKRDFGVCGDILREMRQTPTLGVCLGHQGMILHYGGKVVKSVPMHGKTSLVEHNGRGIFEGVPYPVRVMRYHSLVGVDIPDCLEVTARSKDDNQVMGVRHRDYPAFGVQFHPESIMTEHGKKMLGNFLKAR